MTHHNKTIFSCLAILCSIVSPSLTFSQLPTIQLSALSRAVGQASSTFPVRISEGELTDEVDQLVFTHSGITATLQTSPPRLLETDAQRKFGHFDVTIAADVPPGIYEVRAKGRHGLSNPRAFMVTQSAVQYIEQEHTSAETAIDLSLQQVTVDRTYPQRRNHYKVSLAAGDRFYVCAQSRRLDSRSVIALALLDPNGREVARGRAVGEFPAELQLNVSAAGVYTLLAYDFLYQGGDGFSYALQAVSSPADATQPIDCELKRLCTTSGESKVIVKLDAPGLKPNAADPAAVFAQWLSPSVATSSVVADKAVERAVPFNEVGDFPAIVPSLLFDFKANAGQSLWVEVNSAKLDQLTDPRVIVYKVNRDATGKESIQQLTEQDDAATLGNAAMKLRQRDPYLQFTAPENATYRVLLADNQTGARPTASRNFVLSVREAAPTYELLAYQPFPSKDVAQSKNWASNLARGGTETIHVLVARRDGFGEAIELRVEGLPAGVTCENAIVAAGANEAILVLRAAEDAADSVSSLRVVGRSLGATPIEKAAIAGTILRGVTPTRNAIESRLASNLILRVNANETAPLLVTLGDGNPVEMARGGKLPIGFKVTRRPGGAGKCTLRPQHLPPKVTLGEVAIEGDKAEATAEMVIAPDAPVGTYTMWMQNETSVKYRANPQALAAEEAYAAKLKAAAEDPAQAAQKPMLDEALKAANERVEQLKKSTAERDVTAYLASTPLRIRIVDLPLRLTPVAGLTLGPGSETPVELKIARLFGFADAVDFSFAGKAPVEGLEVAAGQIAAGADTVKLNVKIPASAQAMTTTIPIKIDCKFNGHALTQTVNIELKIAPQ